MMAKKILSSCTCGTATLLWLVVAAVVMAIGFYVGVMTLRGQWYDAATFPQTAVWYSLAFIILAFGKMAKWKAAEGCTLHKCQ